jgi:hypothetical protein
MHARRTITAAVLLLAAAGCGAAQPPPAQHQDGWAKLPWEQRHVVMTFTVLPNMARLFQKHFGKPDPDLTCRSCHGKDAEEVQYAMPHGLPALDPDHLPDASSSDPRIAGMAKFMADEVVPTMADLIEKPDLGCLTCHPRSR